MQNNKILRFCSCSVENVWSDVHKSKQVLLFFPQITMSLEPFILVSCAVVAASTGAVNGSSWKSWDSTPY